MPLKLQLLILCDAKMYLSMNNKREQDAMGSGAHRKTGTTLALTGREWDRKSIPMQNFTRNVHKIAQIDR